MLKKYARFQEKGVKLMTGSKKENISLIATKCRRLVKYLETKNNILLLTTSTRYLEHPGISQRRHNSRFESKSI